MYYLLLLCSFHCVLEARSAPIDLTDRYLDAIRFLYGSDLIHISERIPEAKLEEAFGQARNCVADGLATVDENALLSVINFQEGFKQCMDLWSAPRSAPTSHNFFDCIVLLPDVDEDRIQTVGNTVKICLRKLKSK